MFVDVGVVFVVVVIVVVVNVVFVVQRISEIDRGDRRRFKSGGGVKETVYSDFPSSISSRKLKQRQNMETAMTIVPAQTWEF